MVLWNVPSGEVSVVIVTVDCAGRRSAGVEVRVGVPVDKVKSLVLPVVEGVPAGAGPGFAKPQAAFPVKILPSVLGIG